MSGKEQPLSITSLYIYLKKFFLDKLFSELLFFVNIESFYEIYKNEHCLRVSKQSKGNA